MQMYHVILLFRVNWQAISGSLVLWETWVASTDSKDDVRKSQDSQFSFTQINGNRKDRKLEEFVYKSGGH